MDKPICELCEKVIEESMFSKGELKYHWICYQVVKLILSSEKMRQKVHRLIERENLHSVEKHG